MLKNILLWFNQLNSTRANLVWTMALQVIEKGTGYVVLAILTRTLLKADLGAMFFALSISGLTSIALNFGTDMYLIRRVAGDPQHGLDHLSNVVSIRIINTAGGYVLLNLATWLIQPELSPVMLLVSGYDFLEEIYNSFAAFFAARKQSIYRLFTLGSFKVITLCIVSLVAIISKALIPVLWAYLILDVLLVITSFRVIERNFGKIGLQWDAKISIEILKISFPFFLVNGLTLAHMRFDTVMVGAMLGFQQVANYELGIKLIEAARFVIRPLNSVFLPVFVGYAISAQWSTLRLRFGQFVFAAFGIGFLLLIVMQAFGAQVIEFLFGSNYLESVASAQILFISVPLLFVGLIANVTANALQMERKSVRVVFVAVLINLSLNSFAIPSLGITGAAWVTVISQTVLTLGMLALVLPKLFNPPRTQPTIDPEPELLIPEDDS